MKRIIALTLVSGLMVSACAKSEKVQAVQLGDESLGCQQIMMEMQKVDQSQQRVEGNKGMTGTNVASALFWLPGLAYTYYDAGQAEDLIQQRRSHLVNLYNRRGCNRGR